MKSRKSNCKSLHGCAGRREGDTATDCCQTALRHTGSKVTESLPLPSLASLPHMYLFYSQEGYFEDRGSDPWSLQRQLLGW